jgi:pimeloyl-ACP methyl ester carboxylesterase
VSVLETRAGRDRTPPAECFTGGGELPSGSLDLGVPSDRCLVFLPGFACPPRAYRSFLAPVALRVGRVVVLAVGSLGAQVTGRSTPGNEAVRTVELVDRLRADGVRVWLGGHSRGGLVAWHATPMARAAGLVLVDPVSGGGPPWHPPEPPPPIDPDGPVTVIGFEHGGRCAPAGRNHEAFAEVLPAAAHEVVPECAHADILDGAVGRFGRLTCGHAPDPAAAADAARSAVLDALGATGALG